MTSPNNTLSQAALPAGTSAAEPALSSPAHEWLRAQAFAEPFLAPQTLTSGENALDHARAMATIVSAIDGSPAMQSACFLVYAAEYLHHPHEVIAKAFGGSRYSEQVMLRGIYFTSGTQEGSPIDRPIDQPGQDPQG